MNKKKDFFDFVKDEIKDVQYCAECGKKLKSGGLYYGSRGPYGFCCYQKLYGSIKSKRYKVRKNKDSYKEDALCSMGRIKDCESCVLKDICKEYLDG